MGSISVVQKEGDTCSIAYVSFTFQRKLLLLSVGCFFVVIVKTIMFITEKSPQILIGQWTFRVHFKSENSYITQINNHPIGND